MITPRQPWQWKPQARAVRATHRGSRELDVAAHRPAQNSSSRLSGTVFGNLSVRMAWSIRFILRIGGRVAQRIASPIHFTRGHGDIGSASISTLEIVQLRTDQSNERDSNTGVGHLWAHRRKNHFVMRKQIHLNGYNLGASVQSRRFPDFGFWMGGAEICERGGLGLGSGWGGGMGLRLRLRLRLCALGDAYWAPLFLAARVAGRSRLLQVWVR